MKEILHHNKLAEHSLTKYLQKNGMIREDWALFQKIIQHRKAARSTALILGMATARFRNADELDGFFNSLETASSIYYLRHLNNDTALRYMYRAWKPFIKEIGNRNRFSHIVGKGLNVRSDMRSERNESMLDRTLKLQRVQARSTDSHYLDFTLDFKNEERLYFFQAALSWLIYTQARKVNLSVVKLSISSYHASEVHVVIETGKVTTTVINST